MSKQQKLLLRRTLAIAISVLILIYIGYQVYLVTHTTLDTEAVNSFTVSDSVETDAFMVRNESYIGTDINGTLISVIEDGSRVSKGEAVAAVFTDELSASNYSATNTLRSDIARYTRLSSQSTSYAININSMNSRISDNVIDLVANVDNGDLSTLSEDISNVRDQIITKQIATGHGPNLDAIISGITTKYQGLNKQALNYTSVCADASGFYYSGTDGYETVVDYSKVEDLTVKDIKKIMKAEAKEIPRHAFGKIFKDFDWYMLCIVDSSKVGNLSVGKEVKVSMPYTAAGTIPAKVAAINSEGGNSKTALILRCNFMNSDIAQLRQETVQIIMNTKTGLRISSKAIRVNDKGEKGVFVKSGNVCKFRKVDITYSDKDWVLSAEHEESGYVSLYDNVILEGKGLYDGKIID